MENPVSFKKRFLLLTYLICLNSLTLWPAGIKTNVPFSTDSSQLTIWNGQTYIPFFIKGINLGIAKPGTEPGDLEATREQYARWFSEIKQAGFNCIRIYTLHYPHFYEELRNYNIAHSQHPLFFFQGIWLNEEMAGYSNDLYQFTESFGSEMEENIDCVHGKGSISQRVGKAWGIYASDVSEWNLGFIIGREVSPAEVLTTNKLHSGITNFSGRHFSINEGSPTEVWWANQVDRLVEYEKAKYDTQRPVSVSSWPTLDPLTHRNEPDRTEDTVSVDLSKIELKDAPAGFFISYHAYPYYPDFIGNEAGYLTSSDNYGPNSYLGYLIALKKHYSHFPLIIAEYGVPSSWGVAHYASSGMNHGGYDESEQGETNIRLLNTIRAAKAGGGIQFSWIDEWFKRTWITDPLDFLNRPLWHNITAAEQNFGLVKFVKKESFTPWTIFENDEEISGIKALADFDFFQTEIDLKKPMDILDDCWIAFDTYSDSLGESIMPNGQSVLPLRAEFALHITQFSANLYVTKAYDLFGIYHKTTSNEQKFQSTTSNGAGWNIVRWKNNSGFAEVQYIGSLKLNKNFQPATSKDAVTISDSKISIRIPWTLIQVVDPTQMRVFHDNPETPQTEYRLSAGIAASIFYKNKLYQTDKRFTWEKWNKVSDQDVTEEFKTSYWTMYDQLTRFNSPAIAVADSFDLSTESYPLTVTAPEGLLQNDFDPDGEVLSAVLVEAPKNGFVDLNADGSFTYIPKSGFAGIDVFSYCIFDGQSLSKPNQVVLNAGIKAGIVHISTSGNYKILLFPNPATNFVTVDTNGTAMSGIRLFDSSGKLLDEKKANDNSLILETGKYKRGIYFVVTEIEGRLYINKLILKD